MIDCLIIRGWTPQLLILEQEAGGFVIHRGWNSTLEAIIAGVPMVTWPVSAEQFYNEKLVTGTLNIGVRAGVQKGAALVGDGVKKDAIEKVIMEDKEAGELRSRATKLGEMAKRAAGEGGSSHSDFNAFNEKLKRTNSI